MNTSADYFYNKIFNERQGYNPEEFKKRVINLCEECFAKGNYEELDEFNNEKRMVFETEIWQIGEAIRQIVLCNKKIASDKTFISTIMEVISENKYRSGRQSFVLLFGDFKIVDQIDWLATYLSDRYVYGHVVIALLKTNNFKYCNDVKQILVTEKIGWIKQKCKKYLENCSK